MSGKSTGSPSFEAHDDGSRDYAFWQANGGVGIVWSNADASDSVMIRNALLRPTFHLLLAIAERFGIGRLEMEWDIIKSSIQENAFPEELRRLHRVTPTVERCLAHMKEALR